MSRADELRAQLAAAEAEEETLNVLTKAREYYRENPDDPTAKAAAQEAALALRTARGAHRALRDIGPARDRLQAEEAAFAKEATPERGVYVAAAQRLVSRLEALIGAGVDATVTPSPAGAGTSVERV